MMGPMRDAVVIGAGIAGSGTANALAGLGWDTVLVDQGTFPRHKVCGEFLSPESRAVLAALGLEAAVVALHPVEMSRARLTLASGASLEVPLPGVALGVSRYALDAALHRAVRQSGAEVRTGVTVTSVIPSDRGYRIEMRQRGRRTAIEARAVVAAWGRSRRTGLSDRPAPLTPRSFIGVKTHVDGLEQRPVVELYFFPGGYVGVSPVEGGRVNVAALVTRQVFLAAGRTPLKLIEAASRLNPALGRRLAAGRPIPGTQAAVAPVNASRKLVAWDIVPHVGDAAMVIPPLCGDGMAIALRSAEWCAHLADRYLRGKLSLAVWRDEYTRLLHREMAAPLRWGRFLQASLGVPVVSDALLGLGRRMPGLAFRLVQATRLRTGQSPGL
jgi:flavin-dependent dehydrogenase